MFTLDGNLKFINIDIKYIEELHNICDEVYYRSIGYENKPYLGILIANNGCKYAIPLTSAKPKHINMRDAENDRFLIYEMANRLNLGKNDIWKLPDDPTETRVKHILAVMDLKKMIPVRDDVVTVVDLNPDPKDDYSKRKYKILLNKEYSACIKLKNDILTKATRLYEKQLLTGRVVKYCCDFKKLEAAMGMESSCCDK